MRLIDADAISADIHYWLDNTDDDVVYIDRTELFDLIDHAPTIEPKRGEWIDMGDFEQCSVCKGTHLKEFQSYYGKTTWIKTPYCPNCGASMREREGE